jgi:hypothetical protein
MVKLQIIRMDRYIGVFDPKRKKRLPDLFPTKDMEVRRPASAFESGYTTMISTDLHEQLYGKKSLSMKEYGQLRKKYGRLV